ncbi:hypothetical protein ScPMuIL_003405 [Solemya velum]
MDYNENAEISNGVDILSNQVCNTGTTGTGHVINTCDVINNQSVSCNQFQQNMETQSNLQNNSPQTTMSPVRQITTGNKSNIQNNGPQNTMSPVRQIDIETKSNLQNNSPQKKMSPARQMNSPAKSPKNRSDLRLSGIVAPVTWKNFSPTKEQKVFSRGNSTSSSSDGSPGKTRGSAMNKNQMMTWKDVSPTKSSDGSPTNGFVSSSNSFSANENEVLRIELVDHGGRQIPERAFITSPEDAFNNDYYYDEDFIVQFDTNLRETSPAQQQTTVKDASVMIEFPQMLTGSYLSFNNMRGSSALMEHEQILKQYESELSGSRNSAMEMSSSEREMMCSSDMLDFSTDPLFTPTPTSEIVGHNVSTDSLDRTSRCNVLSMSNSRTSTDGNLGVNCCPKKEEYFLSFEPSQSPAMMSDIETSHGSGPVHWMESQSSGISGEDLEEESSDSFQFCLTSSSDTGSKRNRNCVRNIRSHGNSLAALVERSPTEEDFHSPNSRNPPPTIASKRSYKPSQHFNTKLSPSRRPKKSYPSYRKPANSAPVSPPKHYPPSPTENMAQPRRPKNLMSWRKVQSLQISQKMNDIASSFHSKRHSASLLELYQRLRSDSNPVSPETMCNVDQILFNPNQGHSCFDTLMEEKFLQACEKALKTVDRKRFESSNDSSTGSSCSFGDSTIKALEWKQLNKLRYKDAVSQSERNDYVSKETLISPDTVTLWCGTKNVGSQFPPNTCDCAIQTSIDLAKTSESVNKVGSKHYDRAQQTSLDSTKQELLSMLPENFASLEELLSKIDPKPKMRRHLSCPSEMCKKNINRSQSADRVERNGNATPCLSVSGSSFYSHQSLPDLSFLSSSLSTSVAKDIGLSLFDPMQIPVPVPVFIKPKTEMDALHSNTSTQSLQRGTKLGSQSSHQDSSCVNKCHCRSKSAPPKMHAQHLARNHSNCAESASSSSGFSTSSTSSGIDPGYSDTCKCQNTNPSDLERLLFLPPHVENTQSEKTSTSDNDSSGGGKIIRSKPKFEQYAFESYPSSGENGTKAKIQMRKKENSVSTSSSSSSMHLDNLYSLKEEKTPESSPERTIGYEARFPYRDPLTSYDGLRRRRWSEDLNDSDCSSVEMHNFMYCQSTQYLQQFCYDRSSIPHYDKKPLKSCLRKTARAFKSRSMSDPFNLNWEHEEMKNRKRHSFACDEVYVLPESDHMLPDEGENPAEPVMFYVDQNGDCHMTEQCNVIKTDSTVETDDSDKETSNKRKSVSFASEVSFHAISPQSSPKRQMNKGGNLPMEINGTSEDHGHHSAEDVDSDNSSGSSDTPPTDFPVSGTQSDADMAYMADISRKRVALRDICQASEALVKHFNTAKDPFDKLRLGSTADTPEVGDLVLTHLCLSVAQVVGDGLKPYLDGVHVFGRVQITLWKVAEASAELNPYTAAVHDLVKHLKDRPGFPTARAKFDAFIAGLLNLRLFDFWMGYIRNKDTIVGRYYETDSILYMSQSVLHQSYEEMLISVQPLATLPFHLQFNFILGKMTDSDVEVYVDKKPDEKTNLKSKTRSLTLSAEKALRWLSGSAFPRTKKSDNKSIQSDLEMSMSSSCIDTSTDKNNMSESAQEFFMKNEDRSLTKGFLKRRSESVKSEAVSLDIESSEENLPVGEVQSPVSALARKWLGLGQREKPTYKKGVTDYNFGTGGQQKASVVPQADKDGSDEKACRTCDFNTGMGLITVGEQDKENKENSESDIPTNSFGTKVDLRGESNMSSGIISLFDRLLLPKDKIENKHAHKRWSWSSGTKWRESLNKSRQVSRSLSPLPNKPEVVLNSDSSSSKCDGELDKPAECKCNKFQNDTESDTQNVTESSDKCQESKKTNSMSLENGSVLFCPIEIVPTKALKKCSIESNLPSASVDTHRLPYGEVDINCNSQPFSIQHNVTACSQDKPVQKTLRKE